MLHAKNASLSFHKIDTKHTQNTQKITSSIGAFLQEYSYVTHTHTHMFHSSNSLPQLLLLPSYWFIKKLVFMFIQQVITREGWERDAFEEVRAPKLALIRPER